MPCLLPLFVMTHAMSRGAPEAGLMVSLSMFLGVGLELATVAIDACYARQLLVFVLETHARRLHLAGRAMEVTVGSALLAISIWENIR